jgi:hypothetical protein
MTKNGSIWKRAFIVTAWLCLWLALPPVAQADTTGTVTRIEGDAVFVELPAPGSVKVGDAASIGFEVQGVGAIPLRGTWRVESVDGTNIVLRPAGPGADQPRVGQMATFRAADLPPTAVETAPQPQPGGTGAIGEGSGWMPSGEPAGDLEPEVSGEALRFVQQRLQELGYDPGPADGKIGPRTRDAIRAFQRRMNMQVDGRATPMVHLALGAMSPARPRSEEETARADDIAVQTGNDYYLGENGKVKDVARGCALFETAASHGHAIGLYRLGVCYAFGAGRPQNYIRARELFEQSAAQQYPQAIYNLSIMYHKGLAVAQDQMRALDYMQQAADLGLIEAFHGLGEYYLNGTGTPPSRDSGIYWHQMAARAGFVKSQETLRKMNVAW